MLKHISFAALALGTVVFLTGADRPGGTLDLYFIDVMGGAATLIVTPERESLLVDCGWAGFEERDPRRIAEVLTRVAGLDHLNHLIISHWHADHFGGVAGLSARVPIDRYWDRGLPDPAVPEGDKSRFPDGPLPDDPLGIAYRRASQGKRTALRAGDMIPLKGAVRLVVLASGGEVIPQRGPANPRCAESPVDLAEDRSDNARSLALRLRFGAFDFLDCGDLTWNVEKALVCPIDRIGPIDLFQVTHHGMAISNHPTLLQTIQPTVAIMNNGPSKGGDAATVKRLRTIPSIVAAYQLHRNGATGPDENADPRFIANPTAAGGQFIHVSVAPDGKQFRVSFGTDGNGASFESR